MALVMIAGAKCHLLYGVRRALGFASQRRGAPEGQDDRRIFGSPVDWSDVLRPHVAFPGQCFLTRCARTFMSSSCSGK